MRPITSLLLSIIYALGLVEYAGASETPAGSLLTGGQEQVDKAALGLRDDPGVKVSADAGLKRWSAGSLSNRQAKANSDGSLTYVIGAADPGYYNWLDTGGLHDGLLLVRVENFDQTPDPAKVIREAKIVKVAQLASSVPPDAARAAPAERKQQLADRHSGYLKRVAR